MLQFAFSDKSHRAVSSAPSAPRHPVDMWTIYLKLPNEKLNEASLTERGFCERGRTGWPVANRLKCNLHSCGWISDVGVLYKGIWLPAELHDIQSLPWRGSGHTHMFSHTYELILKETGSGAGQRVIHMLIIRTLVHRSLTDIETDILTLWTRHAGLLRVHFVAPSGASQSVCPCPAP